MSRSIWAVLGLRATRDRDAIRRAYARKLRETNPEDDPDGFMALRQAYEAALSRTSQPERAPVVPVEAPPAMEAEAVAEVPAAEPAAVVQPDVRATEEIDLRGRRDALLAALADDATDAAALLARFEAMLAAPMMAEIGVRAGMADWVAHVVASQLPRADPLVAPAIAAFGWDDETGLRRLPPAVHAVRQRRDELDFVAAAARPHAPLHLGWQALTGPARPPWRRQLAALLPGRPAEVRTLIAWADDTLPGIRDWFDADAEAWWQRWFERERVTGELLLLPLAGWLVALLLATTGALLAALLVALLAPVAPILVVRLVKQPQRNWAENPWDRPAWQREGWMAALMLLPLVAGVVPASPFGIAIIAVAALLVLGWTTIAMPLPRGLPFWHRIGAIIRLAWPMAIFVMAGRIELAPLRGVGVMIVAVTLVIAWWRSGDAIAARVRGWLPRLAPPVVVAAAIALIIGVIFVTQRLPPAERAYAGLLAVVSGVVLMYLADRLIEVGGLRWPVFLGWAAIVVLTVGILGANVEPERQTTRPQPLTPVGTWVEAGDYPPGAMQRPGDYIVEFELGVAAGGAITRCTVTRSSGSAAVDDVTCRALRQRGYFEPARDTDGKPVAGLYSDRIGWRAAASSAGAAAPSSGAAAAPGTATCPADDRAARQPGIAFIALACQPDRWITPDDHPAVRRAEAIVGIRLAIDAEGRAGDCTVIRPSGIPVLDAGTCPIVLARARYLPALDAAGNPVPSRHFQSIRWPMAR